MTKIPNHSQTPNQNNQEPSIQSTSTSFEVFHDVKEDSSGTSLSLVEIDGIKFKITSNTIAYFNCSISDLSILPEALLDKFNQKDLPITHLTVESCPKFTVLRGNEFKGTQQLKDLTIHNTSFRTIHEDSFKSLVSLQHLNLSNNLIEFLHENLFKSMTEMSALYLQHNKLRCLPRNLLLQNIQLRLVFFIDFNQLKNLTYLQFESNRCVSETFRNCTECDRKSIEEQLDYQISLKHCSNAGVCTQKPEQPQQYQNQKSSYIDLKVMIVLGIAVYFILDITLAFIVITKHIRSIQDENNCYIYSNFQFYETPRLILSSMKSK
jgi:hypothetical protein